MDFSKKIYKLANPALGVLPILVYMVAGHYTTGSSAMLIGIVSYVICLVVYFSFFKLTPPYMLTTVGILFVIYISLIRFTPLGLIDNIYIPLVYEVIFLVWIWVSKLFSTNVRAWAIKRDREQGRTIRTTRLNEYQYVIKMFNNILFWHLLIVVLYQILPYHNESLDKFIFSQLILGLVILVILYEYIRLALLYKKMQREDWLPVVNETGGVIGKVAFSISQNSKKAFLHPVVRIVLINKGMFYLMERPPHYVLDPGKLDYPFEKYVRFRNSLDKTIKDLVFKVSGASNLPVKFAFRYLFKSDVTNRLIYLYTIKVPDEKMLDQMHFKSGKWWMEKQIEENLGAGLFSECFEREYEIIKNTVLMADKLVSEMGYDTSGNN